MAKPSGGKAGEAEAPAYKQVALKVETMLADGALTPGEPLPNEAELAARFGVNRSTIRESLRLLEDTGYVDRVSPRKLVAALPGAKSLAARTARALYANRVTQRDVFETTLVVEPKLAAFAALRATADQIDALRRNLIEMERRVAEGGDIGALDAAFHDLLHRASQQLALRIAAEPFNALFTPMVAGLHYHDTASVDARRAMRERLLVAHGRIVDAIERGDAELAELWARRHLQDFERGCDLVGIDLDTPFDRAVLDSLQ